ncbi:MAG: hypothetical protein ACO331_11300 [Prochlorothrix sp.]
MRIAEVHETSPDRPVSNTGFGPILGFGANFGFCANIKVDRGL